MNMREKNPEVPTLFKILFKLCSSGNIFASRYTKIGITSIIGIFNNVSNGVYETKERNPNNTVITFQKDVSIPPAKKEAKNTIKKLTEKLKSEYPKTKNKNKIDPLINSI